MARKKTEEQKAWEAKVVELAEAMKAHNTQKGIWEQKTRETMCNTCKDRVLYKGYKAELAKKEEDWKKFWKSEILKYTATIQSKDLIVDDLKTELAKLKAENKELEKVLEDASKEDDAGGV